MSSELRAGDEFAGHRIEAEAGAGGMGVVYRATHRLLGRTVALKIIAPSLARNAAFRSRFEREWRMLGGLDHPNVIDIYEAGEVDGRPYISMRWVAGGDLAARLRGTTGLEPQVALDILAQVAAALDAAHARGVVHRDIKPANVLIDGERVWLTDFGAGKDLEALDTRTATGEWVGTVHYVAPELLDGGAATPRADVYSLGCVLFEALTGHVPFERENDVATLWAHRFEPPPRSSEIRPGLPGALDDVLRRALAKEPEERPASAGELIRAARAAVAARPAGAATRVGEAAPAPPRRRIAAVLAGAVIMLGIGLATGLALGGSDDPAAPGTSAAKRSVAPLVERIELPWEVSPGAVAASRGLVFVADERDGQIVVVDADTRKLLDPIKVRRPVHDLDLNFEGNHLWATLEDGWLVDIDLETAKQTYARADVDLRRVAIGTGDVIGVATAQDGRRLQRISAARHRPVGRPVENADATTALEPHGDGAMQLSGGGGGASKLTFWDKDLKEPFALELITDGVAGDLLNTGGTVWVPVLTNHTLMSFETTTGKRTASLAMPPKPSALDWEGELLWVTTESGFVQRVNTKSARKVGDPIDTGPLLGPIDLSLGVAWATAPDALVRIENRDRLTEG